MAYSRRTCTKCGYKDIQPNMKQVDIQVKSGKSEAGLSKRALAGAFLGESKKSQRQVGNWLSGNTKRQYYRNKTVWVCGDHVGCGKPAFGAIGYFFRRVKTIFKIIFALIKLAIALGVAAVIGYFFLALQGVV